MRPLSFYFTLKFLLSTQFGGWVTKNLENLRFFNGEDAGSDPCSLHSWVVLQVKYGIFELVELDYLASLVITKVSAATVNEVSIPITNKHTYLHDQLEHDQMSAYVCRTSCQVSLAQQLTITSPSYSYFGYYHTLILLTVNQLTPHSRSCHLFQVHLKPQQDPSWVGPP